MDRLNTRTGNDSNDRTTGGATGALSTILVLSDDCVVIDQIASWLRRHINAQVTFTSIASARLEKARGAAYDLVVADLASTENPELVLDTVRSLGATTLCIATSTEIATLVNAPESTLCTFLVKPLIPEALHATVKQLLLNRERTLRLTSKYRSMRQLVRRIVRERRELNERVELVCKDLVEAHRRLTHRFVELQKANPAQ